MSPYSFTYHSVSWLCKWEVCSLPKHTSKCLRPHHPLKTPNGAPGSGYILTQTCLLQHLGIEQAYLPFTYTFFYVEEILRIFLSNTFLFISLMYVHIISSNLNKDAHVYFFFLLFLGISMRIFILGLDKNAYNTFLLVHCTM